MPKLACKLGDNACKKYEKEKETKMAKEETQICKIIEVVKEENRNRNQTKALPPKRRKLGATTYSCEPCHDELATNIAEKRKPEEAEAGPEKKRLNKSDIRNLFRR